MYIIPYVGKHLFFQDLPEHFEDNMTIWMNHFLTLLNVDNKLLKTDVRLHFFLYVCVGFFRNELEETSLG